MLDDYVGEVLDVVQQIPFGRVMTYGDVARVLRRGGPRQVGTVLALFGGGVPWWRVLRAGGLPPTGCEEEALSRYRAEGTTMVEGARARVDLAAARWYPDAVADPTGRSPAPSSPRCR